MNAGWTAYVDGVKTEIERVNIGFMAVLVGEGEHTVEFRYVSPEVITGAKVSGLAAAVFGAYWVTFAWLDRRKKRKSEPDSFAASN